MTKGRKRQKGKREPNGKLSRRKSEKQARRTLDEQAVMLAAKSARERVHGLNSEAAGTELAGSVVGRLFLTKQLEPEQLSAARMLQDTYAAYQRAMDSPLPPRAVNIGGASRGAPPDITPEQSDRSKSQWRSMVRVLTDANIAHRTAAIFAACDYVVLRDQFLPHLFGDMKLGLNAIARAYGLVARAA